MNKKISVTVPEDFYQELLDYSKYMGHWTLSQFLKHAATQYMRRYPKHAENGTKSEPTSN